MFLLKPSNLKLGAISPTSGAKSKDNAELELNKRINGINTVSYTHLRAHET